MTGSWTVEPGQHLVERRLVVAAGPGRGAGERDVLVQRRVLVAGRRLDRGDDLAGDAELGEVAEARLAVGSVVAHRLVEADQALLDQIVGVAAGQEVGRRLQPHESVVPAHDLVVRFGVSLLGQRDQIPILNLRLSLRVSRQSSHEETPFPLPPRRREIGLSWRATSPGAAPIFLPRKQTRGPDSPQPGALKLELILIYRRELDIATLRVSSALQVCLPIAGRGEDQNGGRRADAQRLDLALDRDGDAAGRRRPPPAVAAPAPPSPARAPPVRRSRPRRRRWHRRRRRRSTTLPARLAASRKSAMFRVRATGRCSTAPAEALQTAGRHLGRAALGDDQAGGSGALGAAGDRAQVLRILDLVESDDQGVGQRQQLSRRRRSETGSPPRTPPGARRNHTTAAARRRR